MEIQENRLYVNRNLEIYRIEKDPRENIYSHITISLGENKGGVYAYACTKDGTYNLAVKYSKKDLVEEIDTFDNNSKAITNLFEIVNFHSISKKDISIYSVGSRYKINKEFFFENNGEITNSSIDRCLFFKIKHGKIVRIHQKKENLYARLKYGRQI